MERCIIVGELTSEAAFQLLNVVSEGNSRYNGLIIWELWKLQIEQVCAHLVSSYIDNKCASYISLLTLSVVGLFQDRVSVQPCFRLRQTSLALSVSALSKRQWHLMRRLSCMCSLFSRCRSTLTRKL